MPRVKVYGEPQVKQQGLPGAQMDYQRIHGADADAFGAAAGRDMQQGAKAIGVAYDAYSQENARQQEIEDADQVFDKKNKFRADLLAVHEQVKSRQGSNAKGAAEWADAETQKIRDKYLGELGNDTQKKIFMQDAESIRLNTRESATAWERQQIDAGLDDKWQSAKELAVSHAAADPNPQNIAAIEAELQRSNAFQAQRKGWDAETLQNETRKDLTKLHSGVFSQIMASEDIGGAQAYMNAHRDKLDPEVVARADKWIRGKALDAYSTKVADQLIAEGSSYADALSLVDKNYKGEDKDKIMAKVRDRYGDVAMIKREQTNELHDKMTRQASKEGVHTLSEEDIVKMDELDPQLGAKWRESWTDGKESWANGGDPPKYSKQEKLLEASAAVEGGKITKQEDLVVYKSSITQSDYTRLSNEIDRRKEIGGDELWNAYRMYLPKDKQSKDKWETKDYVQYEHFKIMAEQGVRDKADKKEAFRFAKEFTQSGYIKGSGTSILNKEFFVETKTRGQALAAGEVDQFVPDGNDDRPDVFPEQPTVVRTGTMNGRKVVEYSDGTRKYVE